MEIKVELTKDDHIQMQIDHNMNSKTMKFLQRLLFGAGILCLLLVLFMFYNATNDGTSLDAGFFAFFLAFGIVGVSSPFITKPLASTIAKSFVNEESIESQIGNTTYKLDNDIISRRSKMRYEELDWRLIQRVVETRKHIYIYDSSISAFIIPKRSLEVEVIEYIINEVKEKMNGK